MCEIKSVNNENEKNKVRLDIHPKSRGNKQRKPVRVRIYNSTSTQINKATTKTGLDWSRWNETSQSLQKPESTMETDTNIASLIESETQDVPSLAGWPWYAWLIVTIITLILLGIVYVVIFYVECMECIKNNGEAFCILNRTEYK